MEAINTSGLTKRFGDVLAVTDLDLRVSPGEVYGFVGPNGAGKSTTIALLLDLLRPTRGSVRVLGLDATAAQLRIRRRVGILPERCGLYARLTGREHLSFAIGAHDAPQTPDDLLDRVGLAGDGDRPTRTYSTGMAQRLRLALALVGEPDLLILDEPSSGLDPVGIARLRDIVSAERDRGAAVFFSSHRFPQVRAVCDRVGILVDGRLRASEPLETIERGGCRLRLVVEGDPRELRSTLAAHPEVIAAVVAGTDAVTVFLADAGARAGVLHVAGSSATVVDVTVEEGSLEGLFAELTGESA